MELVYADENFKINGVSYPGFPIVLNSDMRSIPEVSAYLIYRCIHRGRVNSAHTWASYGQALYDYFGYLEALGRHWTDIGMETHENSPLSSYRNWAMQSFGLNENTVNLRLRVICSFYNYAHSRGWVSALPYDVETVKVRARSGFLAHTDITGGYVASPDVIMKMRVTEVSVLNKEQIKQFLSAINSPSQKLIARLGLGSGLRKEELLTFPLSYILNHPAASAGKSHVRINISPRDMLTKGNKERGIDVPRILMSDLWQYAIHERNKIESKSSSSIRPLFLTRDGTPYTPQGKTLNHAWKCLGLPFKVAPHMLRHTYATHTLYDMRRRKSVVDPLIYLRDRLGHASVITTQKYIHLLGAIEDDVLTEYQDYIDGICVRGS